MSERRKAYYGRPDDSRHIRHAIGEQLVDWDDRNVVVARYAGNRDGDRDEKRCPACFSAGRFRQERRQLFVPKLPVALSVEHCAQQGKKGNEYVGCDMRQQGSDAHGDEHGHAERKRELMEREIRFANGVKLAPGNPHDGISGREDDGEYDKAEDEIIENCSEYAEGYRGYAGSR